MDHEGVKIASLIKCKFQANTKGAESLFSNALEMVNIFAEAFRNACHRQHFFNFLQFIHKQLRKGN